MLKWTEEVLEPYVVDTPTDIVPILTLDSYRCHMMTSVVQIIQGLDVEVEHICDSCTGLCQPIDVGVIKALKKCICKLWQRWKIIEDISEGSTSPPSQNQEHISKWMIDVCNYSIVW